jgi:hypothetical protein
MSYIPILGSGRILGSLGYNSGFLGYVGIVGLLNGPPGALRSIGVPMFLLDYCILALETLCYLSMLYQ